MLGVLDVGTGQVSQCLHVPLWWLKPTAQRLNSHRSLMCSSAIATYLLLNAMMQPSLRYQWLNMTSCRPTIHTTHGEIPSFGSREGLLFLWLSSWRQRIHVSNINELIWRHLCINFSDCSNNFTWRHPWLILSHCSISVVNQVNTLRSQR